MRSHSIVGQASSSGASLRPTTFVASSKQSAKLIRCHTRVASDAAHRVGVHRICSWNDQPRLAVRHHHVAALPNDAIAKFLEHANGVLMADTGKFRHTSNHDVGFGYLEAFRFLGLRGEPFLDRFADVLQSFLARPALGMAAFERGAAHRNPVFVFNQCDPITRHASNVIAPPLQIKLFPAGGRYLFHQPFSLPNSSAVLISGPLWGRPSGGAW